MWPYVVRPLLGPTLAGPQRTFCIQGFIYPSANAPLPSNHESNTRYMQTDVDLEIRNTRPRQDAFGEKIDTPLPSISLTSLTISQPEVATIFHLPLAALISHARLKPHHFRGGRPYWAIDVSDLVPPGGPCESSDTRGQSEINGGRLEVWGLTGWYLCLLMKVLKVYQ